MPTMSYIFITEPYISSYADIDVLLAIWRSGALHYYIVRVCPDIVIKGAIVKGNTNIKYTRGELNRLLDKCISILDLS
jgi:hypothetical protein